jgi:hypothetical protein
MSKQSKSIRKTDDSALSLLYDTLGEDANKVADIDSYYRIRGSYIFLEFIKVKNSLDSYTPINEWDNLKDEIVNVWEFAKCAEGALWLVCYAEEKSEFRLFKVLNATLQEVTFQKEHYFDDIQFKQWFQLLNALVLKG